MLYKRFVFALSLILCSQWLWAQQYQYESFSKNSHTLNYRILYPDNFDKNQNYPVLLFLHGAGERGGDNERQLLHGSKLFLTEKFRSTYPSVIIFPQCAKDDYWPNAKIDRTTYPIKAIFQQKGQPNPSMKLVIALIDSIAALEYSKDDQFYIGGLSMGGMGAYEMLSRRPNLFAGAFVICGGGYPGNVASYSNTALWVFHGAKDNVVPASYSTKMVLAMQEAGGEIRFSLYPDANHNSWDKAFAEPDLISWLFSHKRPDE